MMENSIPLTSLRINETAILSEVGAREGMKRRLLELGFVKGTRVTCVLKRPNASFCAFLIRESVIALRKEDARLIWAVKVE